MFPGKQNDAQLIFKVIHRVLLMKGVKTADYVH